jgi:hypothetical protein
MVRQRCVTIELLVLDAWIVARVILPTECVYVNQRLFVKHGFVILDLGHEVGSHRKLANRT